MIRCHSAPAAAIIYDARPAADVDTERVTPAPMAVAFITPLSGVRVRRIGLTVCADEFTSRQLLPVRRRSSNSKN